MLKPAVSKTGPVNTLHSPYVYWKPLNSQEVKLNSGFWAEKQAVNRKVSLRHGYEMLEKNGNLHNLRVAAGLAEGAYRGRNFIDSDVYKWLEAVAWELGNGPDPELQQMADQAIALVAAAQRRDGYINSFIQVTKLFAPWEDLDHGHELYCAGHLFQAAVAFHRSVEDDRLLDIARRFADHICDVFGEDRLQGACGHPEVEMALIELYRATGEPSYLKTAAFFIDYRGKRIMSGLGPYGPEYQQDHLPVREVEEAIGHTVRQLYLASGVTDLYLETGDPALLGAMQRLSKDIVGTKLYITGGMGSRFDGEAFGDPYELPPDQCYCEACTAIASLMWNWRMLLATGDGHYADQMEQALYNTIIASPSLDGKHFFYINPLMLREARFLRLSSNPPPEQGFIPTERPEWHDVACCPPNVMRTLASLKYYLATRDAHGIQIHHYAPADFDFELAPGQHVCLRIATGYPWQGQIRLEVNGTVDSKWTISLRVPEWSRELGLTVNGQVLDAFQIEKGYIRLERAWRIGDVIELNLNIEPVLMASNPRIDATRASLAILRGPIVYCLEGCDQEVKGSLLDIEIDPNQALRSGWQGNLLDGVMVIEAVGEWIDNSSWEGKLYQRVDALSSPAGQAVRLMAIPYYAWGNRGIGSMRVWIPAKRPPVK
jgi:uncharacterized protein